MTRAEILNCLTDRPCDYCKFHESGRCERWDCVFEEKPDDVEADAISRISVLDTLDNTDEFMDEDRTVENYKALLKECYEVLPSVTPKVAGCEDCISRHDAIHLADELKDDLPDDEQMADIVMAHNEGVSEYQTKLSLLPPVTPKQKMGHWIHFAWSDDCSECGWSTGKYESPTKFCPNCGAKMAESEDAK